MAQTVITAAVTVLIVSVICCRILGSIIFKTIDKYVADMIKLAKESIRKAYSDK